MLNLPVPNRWPSYVTQGLDGWLLGCSVILMLKFWVTKNKQWMVSQPEPSNSLQRYFTTCSQRVDLDLHRSVCFICVLLSSLLAICTHSWGKSFLPESRSRGWRPPLSETNWLTRPIGQQKKIGGLKKFPKKVRALSSNWMRWWSSWHPSEECSSCLPQEKIFWSLCVPRKNTMKVSTYNYESINVLRQFKMLLYYQLLCALILVYHKLHSWASSDEKISSFVHHFNEKFQRDMRYKTERLRYKE